MHKAKTIRKIKLLAILIPVFFSICGCSRFKAPNYPLDFSLYSPKGTVGTEGQYIISSRDEIEVMVWKCPDLNRTLIVRPEDGNITLPLVGDVKASGRTPKGLAKAISKKIAYYVKEPKVAVGVRKFGHKKIFILGEIFVPGTYHLNRGDRIIDLITRAGGFTDNAIPSCTYIVRGDYYDPKIVRVNLGRLLHKADISQNIYLLEGDIVYVPESEIENFNYALRKIFPSMFFADKMSDLKNSWMAGGFDFNDLSKRGHRGF